MVLCVLMAAVIVGFCFSVHAAVEESCEFEGSEEVGVSGDSGWCWHTIHCLEGNFDGHILSPSYRKRGKSSLFVARTNSCSFVN